jgi:hypothetical protein
MCLENAIRQSIIAPLAVLLTTGAMTATATEPAYCVRPVNVVPATESAELSHKLNSQQPLPTHPVSSVHRQAHPTLSHITITP